jgi:hypothetical protein
MLRHLFALIDGQDLAEDTGVHHLKHVLAGGGILLDGLAIPGGVVDNRPPKGPAAGLLRAQDKSAPIEVYRTPANAEGTVLVTSRIGCPPETCDGEDCGVHDPVMGLL